ncbi:MAG TPA: DNA topoisomerase [bacterium]|nr:DNA topoisomerase [bacterium]HPN45533.1 DNA topoisomerase [bacterium]
MSQILVIADSKKKCATLAKYLGEKYTFYSDFAALKKLLPESYTFTANGELAPNYTDDAGQENTATQFRSMTANYKQVIIAADNTPQSELLAATVIKTIGLHNKNIYRVTIREYTRTGIKKAFSHLLPPQTTLISGLKTRLAIEHLIKTTIGAAGTLQHLHLEHIIALGMLCEHADQVEKTVLRDNFVLKVILAATGGMVIHCRLIKSVGKKVKIPNRSYARTLITDFKTMNFKVGKITRQSQEIPAPVPFTTDTLIQEAFRLYGMKPAKTIKAAQKLFNGVEIGTTGRKGLISCYLTGSDYIDPQVVAVAREYIFNNYGGDYLPKKAPAARKDSENGEAIRPLDVTLNPNKIRRYVSEAQFTIYSLIWNRFVAAYMSRARVETTTVEIVTEPEGRYELQETETKLVFRGYKQVYNDVPQTEQSRPVPLPAELRIGQIFEYREALPERETPVISGHLHEAGLWHELYTAGLPSNRDLSEVVGILFAHQLITQHGHELHPTLAGHRLYRYAKSSFPDIYNAGFLKKVEAEIKSVENGQKDDKIVIDNLTKILQNRSTPVIAHPQAGNDSAALPVLQQCPICAGQLKVVTEGEKYYHVCENFPGGCSFKEKVVTGNVEKCPDCGAKLVVRDGRFGRFMACSQYPRCTFTKAFSINVKCPAEGCDGQVVEKRTKDGQLFYGCSHYPQCKFASWIRPVNKICANCGNLYLVVTIKDSMEYFTCPQCNSNWEAGAMIETNEIKVDN